MVKIYSNTTGKDILEGHEGEAGQWLAEIMAKQVTSPVYWQETIENMYADGIKVFIEIGPGTTLSGLAKKINTELTTMHIDDCNTLAETVRTLKELVSQEESEDATELRATV